MNQRNNAKHNKNNPHHKTNNNVNPKNGKNAKKGKGQNNGSQQDSQIVALNKPILSFGCAEEHKEVPASNFQSKKAQKKLKQNGVGSASMINAGNKIKDNRSSYMPKSEAYCMQMELQRNLSKISEEYPSSNSEQLGYLRQRDQIEVCKAMYYDEADGFSLEHEPTDTQAGVFRIRLVPNCGAETQGCYVFLTVTFMDTETTNAQYELEEETAVGLTEEQFDALQAGIIEYYNETPCELANAIQDQLAMLNETTKQVIVEKRTEEVKHDQNKKAKELEEKNKKAKEKVESYRNRQYREYKEEQKWCKTLANQKNKNCSHYNLDRQRRNSLRNRTKSPAQTPIQQLNASPGSQLPQNPITSNGQQLQKKMQTGDNGGQETQPERSITEAMYLTVDDEQTKQSSDVSVIRDDQTVLNTANQVSRYRNDFEQLEEIGRGGFGIVYKARHKLDGNQYAIKKIKLSKHNSEENKRIRREITYLSSLNNQYIVRYFQTWIEHETDADEIAEFADFSEEESDYDSEEDFEMITQNETSKDKNKPDRRLKRQRSSSLQKNSSSFITESQLTNQSNKPSPFMMLAPEVQNTDDPHDVSFPRQRANTDQYSLTPDTKLNGKNMKYAGAQQQQDFLVSESESEEDDVVLLSHQQSEMTHLSPQLEAESEVNQKQSNEDYEGIKILYIQMQYCEGETLESYLKKNAPSKETEKLRWKIYRQILEAVNYLHQRDILHRDIKPENVFLDHNKDARLGDFGLAKRLTHQQKMQMKQEHCANKDGNKEQTLEDLKKEDTPLFKPNCSKNLTTGLGTHMYAAPEQIKGNKCYGFKADIYSLGLVLMDLFRNHDISFMELQEIYDATRNERITPSLEKELPPEAIELVKQMVRQEPSKRPTLLDVLTSDALPQDEILKNLIPHLKNHKSSVKLQLLRFLGMLQVPKALWMQFHGTVHEDLRQFAKSQLRHQKQYLLQNEDDAPTPGLPKGHEKKKTLVKTKQREKQAKELEDYLKRETLREKVEARLLNDLRDLFESNGARELINLPVIGPIPNERTIFLSKPIILWEKIADIKESLSDLQTQGVLDALTQGCNHNQDQIQKMIDEFFVLDGADESRQDLEVTQLLPDGLPTNRQGSCWQELVIKNIPELLEPKHASKLLDQTGIVVGLQPQLLDPIAQTMAQTRPQLLSKVYSIGQTFKSSARQASQIGVDLVKLAPQGENHACFACVSPNMPKRHETHTLSEMSEGELMLEVDLLRICDSVFKSSKLGSRYEIRVSSSELIDAIFTECEVDKVDHVHLLKVLYDQRNSEQNKEDSESSSRHLLTLRKDQFPLNLRDENLRKLTELMKIKGSCDQVEKQLNKTSKVRKPRFKNILKYFHRLEDRLKLFQIYAEPPKDTSEKPIETKKEAAINRPISSSSGKIRSRDKDISASRQHSTFQKRMSIAGLTSESGSTHQIKLVFDFGLILEQSLAHYSGLQFAVTVKDQQRIVTTRKNRGYQTHAHQDNVTLAYGGRFDNNIANFQQFALDKYLPASLAITFNCHEMANQIVGRDGANDHTGYNEHQHSIDFCIGSVGAALLERKIQVMQYLQLEGYSVHADYTDNMDLAITNQFIDQNNVRFKVILLENENQILVFDRYGFVQSKYQNTSMSPVQLVGKETMYNDIKQLVNELQSAKKDAKIDRQNRIFGLNTNAITHNANSASSDH